MKRRNVPVMLSSAQKASGVDLRMLRKCEKSLGLKYAAYDFLVAEIKSAMEKQLPIPRHLVDDYNALVYCSPFIEESIVWLQKDTQPYDVGGTR